MLAILRKARHGAHKVDQEESATKQSGRFPLLAVVAWLITKGSKFMVAIFKVKIVFSLASALVSILAYWWTYHLGLAGAVLLVAIIAWHEMGHVLVNKYYKIPSSLPMFIPFLGALITWKKYPESVDQEAWSALGGPAFGLVSACICAAMYYFFEHSTLWLWGATVAALINLFNLIPLSPLDGGRVVAALWRGIWYVGLVMLAGGAIAVDDPFLWIIALVGYGEIRRRYSKPPTWVLVVLYTCLPVGGLIWWRSNWEWLVFIGFAIVGSAATAIWSWWFEKDEEPETEESSLTTEAYFVVPNRIRAEIGLAYLSTMVALGLMLYWMAMIRPA
jgi:Zn-dependent protease